MRGTGSLLITKDASNRQGNGCAISLGALEAADLGQGMTVIFELSTSSAYLTGDLRVYAIGIPSGNVLEAVPTEVSDASPNLFSTTFYPQANTDTQYLLALHVASTSALAWTAKLDNILVGKGSKTQGTVSTPWKSFTPTGTFSTNTTYATTSQFRRVGDSMEAMVKVSFTGAPNAVTFFLNIPNGLQIDTAKVNDNVFTNFGTAMFFDASTNFTYIGSVVSNASDGTQVRIFAEGGVASNWSNTVPVTIATGDTFTMRFTIPILGWGTAQALSSDIGHQPVGFNVYRAGADIAVATTNETQIVYDLSSGGIYSNLGGQFNPANGTFVAAQSGYFCFNSQAQVDNLTAGDITTLLIRIGASAGVGNAIGADQHPSLSSTTDVYRTSGCGFMNKGQVASATIDSTADSSYTVKAGSTTSFSGHIVAVGLQQLIKGERTEAIYSSNSGQSLADANTLIVNFEDKELDNTNGVTIGAAWKYTASRSELCYLHAHLRFASTAWASGDTIQAFLYKNGNSTTTCDTYEAEAATTNETQIQCTGVFPLVKGDFIDFRINQNNGANVAKSLGASTAENRMYITCD